MTRATANRSIRLVRAAAGFAVLSLLAGKIFIFLGSTGAIARSVESKDDVMRSTVAWWLYDQRVLDAATLEARRFAGCR